MEVNLFLNEANKKGKINNIIHKVCAYHLGLDFFKNLFFLWGGGGDLPEIKSAVFLSYVTCTKKKEKKKMKV